jgi:hypothetical protein
MHGQLAAHHPGVLPFLGSSLPQNPTRETPAWLATKVATRAREALEGKPLREAVEAVASVADTLAALHERNISHRDIKPDNLFRYEDRWVVGDFGLVDYPDKESLTDTGERLGPFHYLAPEMLADAKNSEGRTADVYSLGKTLWVLATEQHLPPPGEQRADNTQLGIGAYRAQSATRQLDLLIERATRNNPNDRPSMAEFVAELRAWLATPRVQAHPDLSDILAQVRERAEPSLRAHHERLRQGQEAEELSTRLANLMLPIVQAFVATGLAFNAVKELKSADPVFLRQRTMDMPTAFWQRGLAVTAEKPGTPLSWATRGIDYAELTCAVGLELRVDGTIRLLGGYAIGSMYGPEFIAVQEYVTPLGSSLQEKAVSDLFNQLIETLPKAIERFIQWIEAEGNPPRRSPHEAGQTPPP